MSEIFQDSETNLYFPQATFERKQASNESTQSNSRLFEQRSNFNTPPSLDRNRTQTIPKQNKPKYEYDINGYRKDHREQNVRYKSQFEDDFNYDNGRADRDWIDVKSNNYFSGNASSVDKGPVKKNSNSNGRKPEWRNVYGKASQPADGAVNAFQWSD